VASHDFESCEANYDHKIKDWGVFQIHHAFDLNLTGFKYVDCFLSAGLSSHRVHHLLPFQKTGFSNIFSEDFVEKIAVEKFGIEWKKPKNYWTERLPIIIQHNLWASRVIDGREKKETFYDEHVGFEPIFTSLKYVILGFLGEGAI